MLIWLLHSETPKIKSGNVVTFIPWPCLSTFYLCQIYIRFFWALLSLLTPTFPFDQFLFPLSTRFSHENDEFRNLKALWTVHVIGYANRSRVLNSYYFYLWWKERRVLFPHAERAYNSTCVMTFSSVSMRWPSPQSFVFIFFYSNALDTWWMSVNEVPWSRGWALVSARSSVYPSVHRSTSFAFVASCSDSYGLDQTFPVALNVTRA